MASPFLKGMLLHDAEQRANQEAQLRQMQGVLGLQGLLMKQQQMQQDQAEQQRVKALLPQISEAISSGNHQMGLGLLAQIDPKSALQFAFPKPQGPVSVRPGGALVSPDGKLIYQAPDRPEKPAAPSNIGKLIAERDALPMGDPRRQLYDKAIAKQSTHSPAVQVNMPPSSDTVQGPDGRFYKFRIGKDGKTEAVPIQTAAGDPLRPPVSASERRAEAELAQGEVTVQSVRDRIANLSRLVQQNPTAVGAAGVVRRGLETAGGVAESLGGPAIPTPALDFNNEQALLLGDVRKLVEKDPNLSKDERERLYTTLGGGTFQTPSSAVRAMNNVLQYVEGKKLAPSRGSPKYTQDDLEFTARKHGITVEEVKRRLGVK